MTTIQPSPRPTRTLPAQRYLAAALRYAESGVPVFLLGRTKRPVANCPVCPTGDLGHDPAACGCLTCHGFYAATCDPDRIKAMLAAIRGGLLAIRTGATSGLLVVDVDPRNGGRIDSALMIPTATVATGGGGWHLYYAHPGGTMPCGKLPGHAGVDIKADGGYVLAPPSIHPNTHRPYRWIGNRPIVEMPPPLLAALQPAPQPPAPPVTEQATIPGAGGISCPAALLAAHLDAVRRAPVGRRRVTLYGAARGLARMVAAGAITAQHARQELTAVGRKADQSERDIRAAIDGGFHDEGVTPR